MTQMSPEIQVIETKLTIPEPLDAHIAAGIAVHGLFCNVQQELVANRLTEAFTDIREDVKPNKHRSYTIARAMGSLSLEGEDTIDAFIHQNAAAQNHGTFSH